MQQYDLVLKGGRVVDPSQGLDAHHDVAVRGGRIAVLARDIPHAAAARVVDVEGSLVVPGLIDFHTHVYWGGTWSGIDPRGMPETTGVTTLVDAGSSGAGTFHGLLAHVIERFEARILAFLNISFSGLVGGLGIADFPEAGEVRLLNAPESIRVARGHPAVIRGIKVRLGRFGSGALGTGALDVALEIAEAAGLPVMAHLDDPPPRVAEVLARLRPGDVLTHAFRAAPNALVYRDGTIRPETRAARERGVLFDVGHGLRMFSLATARSMGAQGIYPDVISSDIYRVSSVRTDLDMPALLSKLRAVGMGLSDVIRAVTDSPARILGLQGTLGTLAPGAIADLTVLREEAGAFTFQGIPEQIMRQEGRGDGADEQLTGDRRLRLARTVVAGRLVGEAAGEPAAPVPSRR